MDIEATKQQLRKGLLVLALLSVISSEELYVADILKRLAHSEFATQEGTLYPLLSRLKRERLIQYRWVESPAGPPRKYYQLTDAGRTYFDHLQTYWQTLGATLETLAKETKHAEDS